MFKEANLCSFKIGTVQPFHIATGKRIFLYFFSSLKNILEFPPRLLELGCSIKLISREATVLISCLRPHLWNHNNVISTMLMSMGVSLILRTFEKAVTGEIDVCGLFLVVVVFCCCFKLWLTAQSSKGNCDHMMLLCALTRLFHRGRVSCCKDSGSTKAVETTSRIVVCRIMQRRQTALG